MPATQKGGAPRFCAFFCTVENHHFCIILTKAWQWWWSHSFQPFPANTIFSSRMHSIAIIKTIESWQQRFSLFLFLEQSRRVFVRSPQNLIRALAGCQLQATGNCQGSPIHLPRAWHGDFLIFSEDWFYFKCQCTKICRTSDLMVLRKSMARLEFVSLGPAMHGYFNCGLQATILADNIQHWTRCWLCHIRASFFNYPFLDVKLGWWSVGEVPVDIGLWIRWLLQWSL